MTNGETPVANPTYMKDIRHFFEPIDIDHMNQFGIDLATYEGVKAKSTSIYFQTLQPGGSMPPEPNRKWSAARSETFKNWIVAGCPRGTAQVAPQPMVETMSASRIRRDITELSTAEIDKLKGAFHDMIQRDPDDATSYFSVAGLHWLPAPTFCLHHENRYNPWHRVYMRIFEDALRKAPGCGDITLPYWDITKPIPDVLYEEPFATYTLPRDIGQGFNKGFVTQRYDAATVNQNLKLYGVTAEIQQALGKSVWEGFDVDISSAHDSGHVASGETMANQAVASFDPMFWFFHANWDRLWWKWQNAYNATTLATFKSTLSGPADWLSPPFNTLPPFTETADQTIDPGDIGYAHPAGEPEVAVADARFGSLKASKAFTLASTRNVSARVKGVDRLKLPGSFTVHLMADGETIARKGFFQPMVPKSCPNCREKGVVDFDFVVDSGLIDGKTLSVGIEMAAKDRVAKWFPLSAAGEPSVNLRLLLEQQ